MENGKALRNLIKKYRKQYIRRHGFERGGPQEEEYWQRIYHTEHLKGLKEYNKVHDPDNDYDWDPQGNLKDRLWHARKETYYTYFNSQFITSLICQNCKCNRQSNFTRNIF